MKTKDNCLRHKADQATKKATHLKSNRGYKTYMSTLPISNMSFSNNQRGFV